MKTGKKKGRFPHIGQDLGKQVLEEGGRHSCVKSKAAIPRIMGNASGRGGDELHERGRRRGWRGHSGKSGGTKEIVYHL